MCGLTGFLQNGIHKSTALNVLESMLKPLHHRGPDDGWVWYDEDGGIGLAHRRLSIVDLYPAGNQPMASRCGRFIIVFNGEINKFRALKTEPDQKGHLFKSHRDTEVLLHLYQEHGADMLNKLRHFFWLCTTG